MVTVLHFTDVSFVRDGRAILDGLNWTVNSDERWVVLGPNGAGKTTALGMATAQTFPTRGTVDVLDERLGKVDVFELRNRIGFASSAHARLIPANESVRDVVLTAAYSVAGRWNEQYDSLDLRQAERVLAEWDLLHLADRTFGTLSDGERKRAMIARAVMTDPELLLLDEPSLGIAPKLVQDIARAIVSISRDEGVSVLLVEQNSRMALSISNRAYAMSTGQVVLSGVSKDLMHDDRIKAAYLGGDL